MDEVAAYYGRVARWAVSSLAIKHIASRAALCPHPRRFPAARRKLLQKRISIVNTSGEVHERVDEQVRIQAMTGGKKTGFTLVELLVVIAIIGILVALLLPAVQAAREAARRTSCVNQMKQISLALHNHYASRSAFPSGFVSSSSSCPGFGGGGVLNMGPPWSVLILPYLEDNPRYDSFDFDEGFVGTLSPGDGGPSSTVNYDEQAKSNPSFQCASDPNSNEQVAVTNYVGVMGGGTDAEAACTATLATQAAKVFFDNGILYANSKTKMRNITDGSSNVFLIGETVYQASHDPSGDRKHTWAGHRRAAGKRCCTNPTTLAAAVDGINSRFNSFGVAAIPNSWRVGNHLIPRLFGSFHPGGCHMGMADGSVHFFNEEIDINVYRDLGDRSDGMPMEGLGL